MKLFDAFIIPGGLTAQLLNSESAKKEIIKNERSFPGKITNRARYTLFGGIDLLKTLGESYLLLKGLLYLEKSGLI